MKLLRILPPVLTDITEAAAWYDENGYEGLGDRFIESFYKVLSGIQENDEIHRIVYRDFRRTLIPPFPYFVYYASMPEQSIITLVIHASRRPALARKMLKLRADEDYKS
jgi:hypothetical protein